MRALTQQEIDMLDEDSMDMIGYSPVEITIGELADMNVETACQVLGEFLIGRNYPFQALAAKKYNKRKCRCWLSDVPIDGRTNRIVNGMFHIKVQTETTAEKIEIIASNAGGSLRFDSESIFEGFMVFEIE